MKRLKRAFRTNEAQAGTVGMLTCMNCLALLMREGSVPWQAWIAVIIFWPVVAIVLNFFDPIP